MLNFFQPRSVLFEIAQICIQLYTPINANNFICLRSVDFSQAKYV